MTENMIILKVLFRYVLGFLASWVVLFPTHIAGAAWTAQQGRQYDVAPEGRFLVNTVLDSAPTPITLIQNWQPEATKWGRAESVPESRPLATNPPDLDRRSRRRAVSRWKYRSPHARVAGVIAFARP
jgi:hypothetical protein